MSDVREIAKQFHREDCRNQGLLCPNLSNCLAAARCLYSSKSEPLVPRRVCKHGWKRCEECNFNMDNIATKSPNPKDALGKKKIPLRFIPWAAIAYLARVMRGGAAKYGWMNWREHEVLRSVYIEAAMRHLMSLADGENIDPESNEPHEAHVMACMAILLDAKSNNMLIDDRPKDGAFGRLVQEMIE
jgi:hypothetical protein